MAEEKAKPVQFQNPDTAKKYETTKTKDVSIVVLAANYSGKLSNATPEACAKMIEEGVNYIKEVKPATK
jgi:hypothetical protein